MPDATRLGGHAARPGDPWRIARETLSDRCPKLAQLIRLAHPIAREIPDPRPITHLAVRVIIGQLVSTAAARTITDRLLVAHGSFEGIAEWARTVPPFDPPIHGLSRAKRRAIGGWGDLIDLHGDPRDRWTGLTADALRAEIMALRGFGRWSADMLAIFGFGHPDIWPEGDVAVMRIMRQLYPRYQPATIRKRVSGHSSFAALCCWSVIDRGREADLD